jgi:hypothetical protein
LPHYVGQGGAVLRAMPAFTRRLRQVDARQDGARQRAKVTDGGFQRFAPFVADHRPARIEDRKIGREPVQFAA